MGSLCVEDELTLGDLEEPAKLIEEDTAAVTKLLTDCFGVQPSTGTCIRHTSCPVVTGLCFATTGSGNSSGDAAPAAPTEFRVVSCRVCYAEEKSTGIRQYPTLTSVVQQLQAHAGINEHNNNNSSAMFHGSMANLSIPSEPVGPNSPGAGFTAAPHISHNGAGTAAAGGTSDAEYNNRNGGYPPAHNTAARVLHFMQQPGSMERCLKRLNQVQNWMLRSKETELLQQQLLARTLQQRLTDSQAQNEELKARVKQLRRTIQQDLKVIKTMATQQLEDELAASSQHFYQGTTTTDDPMHGSGSTGNVSPMKRAPGMSPLSNGTASGGTGNIPSAGAPIHRFSPAKRSSFVNSTSSAMSTRTVPIPEDDEQDLEAEPTAMRTSSSSGGSGSSSNHHRQYWNNDTLKSSKIFQSFRGGLLDIPKSPPLARHDRDDDANGGRNGNKQKLHLNMAAMDALQLDPRALSRSNSSAAGHHQSNNNNNNNTEIPLAELAAKLAQQPAGQRPLGVQSPEQFFAETVPAQPGMPMATPLFVQSPATPATIQSPASSHATVTYSILTLETGAAQTAETVDSDGSTPTTATTTNMASLKLQPDGDGELHVKSDGQPTEAATVVSSSSSTAEASAIGTFGGPDKFVFSVTRATCQDKFGDEGTYTGNILVTEGLPHGEGKMEYESGRVYDGEWMSGQWHGKGNLLNPNGDSYDGEFFFDARHGQGVYRWDNGDVYVGSFSSDKRHGMGKFSFHNGNVYNGEFCDGMFEGFGRYEFADGYYEGDWKEGRYDGTGELMYAATGGKYTGEFRNSVAHGFGMEVMPDGRKRRGVWVDGTPSEYFEREE